MPVARKRLRTRLATIALSVSLIAGCATGTDPRDPLEPFNRGVYSFNENVDRALLRPIAEAYRAVLPQFVRSSVSNFFSNVNDVVVALNNLLQGKFTTAYSDFGRIAINSTVGVLGLFDVASEAGIEKHEEDFGQTLGWWGMENGPFIMIPFLGPSTGRDAVGRVADVFSDPATYVDPTRTRNWIWGTRVVNRRAELLEASTVLQTAALDPYEFVRDAYLQRRRNLVHDGAPPPDREFLDPPAKPRSSAPQSTIVRAAPVAPAAQAALDAAPSRAASPVTARTSVQHESPFPSSAHEIGPAAFMVSADDRSTVRAASAEASRPESARLPTLAQLWRSLTQP